MSTVGFLLNNMSIQLIGVCQFDHMIGKPVKDQRNHRVDKCGYDWHRLI